MAIKVSKEVCDRINDVVSKVSKSKVMDDIANLSFRWKDEKEYEDFNEYNKVLKESLDSLKLDGVKFVKAIKRPFGITFTVDNHPILVRSYISGHFFKCDFKAIK